MNNQNHQWYLRFKEKRYPVDYSVYHLTNGVKTFEVHEIEYNGRLVSRRSLEDAISTVGKLIRKAKK